MSIIGPNKEWWNILDKIILFHKQDLGSFNLVFKDFKFVWRLFISAGIISGIGVFLVSIKYWPQIVIVPLVGLFFTTFFIVNWKAKKKLISEGIVSEGFLWGGVGYQKKRAELMLGYLENNNNNYLKDNELDKDKIKLLIELLYKRSEKNQPAGLVGTGLLLATFIPLWNQLLSSMFKTLGNIEQAFLLFGSIFLIISMIVFIIRMIQIMLIDIFDSKRKNVRDLARMLEELFLEFK